VSLQISTNATDEDLQFASSSAWPTSTSHGRRRATLENFIHLKQRVEAAKLKVWNIGNSNVHNMPEVTLNLPGRDQKIEEYKRFLRNLAKAGIFYTTYAHMGNGIWSSARETTRGGAPARAFDMENIRKEIGAARFFKVRSPWPQIQQGRAFGRITPYFIKPSSAAAEDLGMRIGIHPTILGAELGGVRAASSGTSHATCGPWRSP